MMRQGDTFLQENVDLLRLYSVSRLGIRDIEITTLLTLQFFNLSTCIEKLTCKSQLKHFVAKLLHLITVVNVKYMVPSL